MTSQTAVTIVSPMGSVIDAMTESRAIDTARAGGAEVAGVTRLDPDRAIDIILNAASPVLHDDLRRRFSGFGNYDIFVQNAGADRRKKLFVADMDATMVEGETLDDIAHLAGIKDKIAPITAAAMRGEIDFFEALRQRIALLRGTPLSLVFRVVEESRPARGSDVLLKTLKRHGVQSVLVSGGFDYFTAHVASLLGFDRHFGNRLGVAGDHLTGEVIPPIVDKDFKKRTVEDECRKLGIPPALALSIGDGANDIPMLQTAGTGIGYFPKPAVAVATPHHIRHTDMTAVLYMQGYRKEEFSA
jgi:phosphoserine phosphatase